MSLSVVELNANSYCHRVPDSYHTLYTLSGLSSAQHNVVQLPETAEKLRKAWVPIKGASSNLPDWSVVINRNDFPDDKDADERSKIAFVEARSWVEEEGSSKYLNGGTDRVVSRIVNTYW